MTSPKMDDRLTREQIEAMRTVMECNLLPRADECQALCDLALRALRKTGQERERWRFL
jgi:hypothetical protein